MKLLSEDIGDFSYKDDFIQNVKIMFDLPFVLLLEDSIIDNHLEQWYGKYESGDENLPYHRLAPPITKASGVQSVGGPVIYVSNHDIEGKGYRVYLSEIQGEAIVTFIKRLNTNNNPIINAESFGDTTGRISYSTVIVDFKIRPYVKDSKDSDFYHHFIDLSIIAVNKIIDIYRLIHKRYYITRINKSIIVKFYPIAVYIDNSDIIIGIVYYNRVIYAKDNNETPSNGFTALDQNISEYDDQVLRNSLKKNIRPATLLILNAEVNNRLFTLNIKLLIIECAIYFEAWLNIVIREIYRNKYTNIDQAEIENKFKIGETVKFNRTQKKEIQQYILDNTGKKYEIKDEKPRNMAVSDIVDNLFEDAFGFKFSSTREWKNLKINVVELRNKIIHGNIEMQFLEENEDQALLSFNSLKSALFKIKTDALVDEEIKNKYFNFFTF